MFCHVDWHLTSFLGVEKWRAAKRLVRFYATVRAILRIGGKFGRLFATGWKQRDDFKLEAVVTWISWILLNPSLQKNSIKLDKVLGPGISFRVLTVAFSPTSAGAISLSAMDSSPAAEIPKASLAADLCKARKMENSCLFGRSPWKFLQHAVVNLFRIAIV